MNKLKSGPGTFIVILAVLEICMSFLFVSLTDAERWIIIIFCIVIMFIGILFQSRKGGMFKETVFQEGY